MSSIETVSLIVIIALVIFLNAFRLLRSSFQCKACGHTFSLSRRQALFQIRISRNYVLRCPYCGKLGLCRILRHTDEQNNR